MVLNINKKHSDPENSSSEHGWRMLLKSTEIKSMLYVNYVNMHVKSDRKLGVGIWAAVLAAF